MGVGRVHADQPESHHGQHRQGNTCALAPLRHDGRGAHRASFPAARATRLPGGLPSCGRGTQALRLNASHTAMACPWPSPDSALSQATNSMVFVSGRSTHADRLATIDPTVQSVYNKIQSALSGQTFVPISSNPNLVDWNTVAWTGGDAPLTAPEAPSGRLLSRRKVLPRVASVPPAPEGAEARTLWTVLAINAAMFAVNPDHDNRIDVFGFTHSHEITFRSWDGINFVDRPGWPRNFAPFLPTPPVVGDIDGDGEEDDVTHPATIEMLSDITIGTRMQTATLDQKQERV